MTTYVLVHGAWHGGWCWRRVRTRLQAAGHEVHAPTLTGLGERAHLTSPQVGLSTHVDDVLGLLACEDLHDVVLCGHSYGGMVITGVAAVAADRLKSLVYLDAMVPEPGQSAFDLLAPERADSFRRSAREDGNGWRMAPVKAAQFGVTDPDDAAWVDGLCVPMAIRAFEEPLPKDSDARTVARRVYILAGAYNPSTFQGIYAGLKDDPDWVSHVLPTGHDAMVTMPEELSRLLLEEA